MASLPKVECYMFEPATQAKDVKGVWSGDAGDFGGCLRMPSKKKRPQGTWVFNADKPDATYRILLNRDEIELRPIEGGGEPVLIPFVRWGGSGRATNQHIVGWQKAKEDGVLLLAIFVWDKGPATNMPEYEPREVAIRLPGRGADALAALMNKLGPNLA